MPAEDRLPTPGSSDHTDRGDAAASSLSADELRLVFQRALRSLLWRLQFPRLDRSVQLLMGRAARKTEKNIPASEAFQQLYTRVRQQVIERLLRDREQARRALSNADERRLCRRADQTRRLLEKSIIEAPLASPLAGAGPDFQCDSGLGGMARWLRAAGYDARFWPGIDDDELVDRTAESCAIMLTTDSRLVQRGAIRWGAIPALLVPLNAGKRGQFNYVMRTLGLPRLAARCMACGGSLRNVPKESVRQRVPPRTYPRCNTYLECERCRKLYWEGTHWQHIERSLAELAEGERWA